MDLKTRVGRKAETGGGNVERWETEKVVLCNPDCDNMVSNHDSVDNGNCMKGRCLWMTRRQW